MRFNITQNNLFLICQVNELSNFNDSSVVSVNVQFTQDFSERAILFYTPALYFDFLFMLNKKIRFEVT